MSDVTGEVYEYRSIDTPLFCGKSGLFLVVDENPYKEECYVRVYKMLPEGRLAEVAALNRGGGDYFEVDLDDFVWVGEKFIHCCKKRRKMNMEEDALTVAWKSTGSVAICKSTKTWGVCARRSSS